MRDHSNQRRLHRWLTLAGRTSAPVFVALAAACGDRTSTAPMRPLDDVVATASGTVHVLGQPALLQFRGDVAGQLQNGSFAWAAPRHLLVQPGSALSPSVAHQATPDVASAREALASASADHLAGAKVTSRKFHHRDRSGHVTSLAIVDGADTKHPKAAYQFVDGVIQAVASFSYDLGGRPSSVLYTMFDNGRAQVQIRQSFNSNATAAIDLRGQATRSILDRLASSAASLASLAIPAPLYALDANCGSQWDALAAASATLAMANAQVAACVIGVSCLSDPQTAAAALVVATNTWNSASSAVAACVSGSSGGSGNGSSGASSSYDDSGLDGAIDSFIGSSGTAGYCDDAGDDCVYLNET